MPESRSAQDQGNEDAVAVSDADAAAEIERNYVMMNKLKDDRIARLV